MTETPMALEVCCCGNCEAEGHTKEVCRPLTAEEVAQRDADAAAWQAAQDAEAAALAEKAAALASADAKLAALGLTPGEIAALRG